MTNSTIAQQLLKQLEQLPIESQEKVLEFAQVLNITTLKGKPGKDLLEFAGTIDPDKLKVMEEAVAYGKMKVDLNLERIEREVSDLSMQDQLELIKKMINNIETENLEQNEANFCWNQFYGIAKGLWQEDAQTYVEHLREDR